MSKKRVFSIVIFAFIIAILFANAVLASDVKKDYGQIGTALMETELVGLIKIGLTDKDVIKILGKDAVKGKAEVWGADGLTHQDWNYKKAGVSLGFVNSGKKWLVSTISVEKPCDFKTARNIGIKSTRAEVCKAYENEIDPENAGDASKIIAGSLFGGVVFTIEKDVVTAIFIGASAE
ncbi:MAG TPA: hypothetical protein PKK26_15860 [Candidatus Wallbacteria bacterium]|nr:hypothetical protein [Candidatus Wallbacteria bacterium]